MTDRVLAFVAYLFATIRGHTTPASITVLSSGRVRGRRERRRRS